MFSKGNQPFAHAMAFYHQDGLTAAWKQAMKFAGAGGRLATMPDIVAARLETKPGDLPWETYFTTLTAEYCGISKTGKRILIVAHGVGPMSTLEGAQKAYSWEYRDKDRNRRGGRITQQQFLDLEAGKFGQVTIIDLEQYFRRYRYPFIQTLRSSEAITDPMLKARFGPQAEDYIRVHAEFARQWHREHAGLKPTDKYDLSDDRFRHSRGQHFRDGAENSDPYIVTVADAANCSYGSLRFGFRPIESGYAIAHLVSTGCLTHLHHEGNESLTLDVSCHEWWNGVRVVGIKAGGSIRSGLNKGPDAHNLLRKYWRDLLVPVYPPDAVLEVGFRGLVQIGDQWFTQYPKIGERMDTWEPEHVVISMEKVGDPIIFRTTVGGYHGFFRFGVNEVQAIAPPNANAYFFVGEPQNEWNDGNPTHQTCEVQFYRIEADTSKRMVRADNLVHDYERMMALMTKEAA